MLLPHAVRFNGRPCPTRSPASAPRWATRTTRRAPSTGCGRASACPARLSEVGVDEDELEAVARLSQSNANVAANPRPLGEADVLALLRAAW